MRPGRAYTPISEVAITRNASVSDHEGEASILIYFERLTPVGVKADAHIQTSCTPDLAAAEFSWDHPSFRGLVEVSVQVIEAQRPRLIPTLFQVAGPGCCHEVSENYAAMGTKTLLTASPESPLGADAT